MVYMGGCASRGTMPQFTNPPSMTRERVSWNPTEADEPKTRREKPGAPTAARSGLPDGLASSGEMPISVQASWICRQRHAPNSTNLVSSLNLR